MPMPRPRFRWHGYYRDLAAHRWVLAVVAVSSEVCCAELRQRGFPVWLVCERGHDPNRRTEARA